MHIKNGKVVPRSLTDEEKAEIEASKSKQFIQLSIFRQERSCSTQRCQKERAGRGDIQRRERTIGSHSF